MTKATAVTRLYDRLDPDERFRLVLAARARDDEQELHRLEESCPREIYKMLDAAFTGRVDASRDAALVFTVLYQHVLRLVEEAWLPFEQLESVKDGYAAGVNAGWQLAGRQGVLFEPGERFCDGDDGEDRNEGGEGPVRPERRSALREQRERDYREAVAALKGLHEGFTRFCERADLDPDTVLGWSPFAFLAIRHAEPYLALEVPSNEFWADQVFEAFEANYPALTESPPSAGRAARPG
jgi:hypothetical protein